MWGAQRFKVPANYTRDTYQPHAGRVCFRIHHPAGTRGYVVSAPDLAIRPRRGMIYTVSFWARAATSGRALFQWTAYRSIDPFIDAPSPGSLTCTVGHRWRRFSCSIREGLDFFADQSRYLMLTFHATMEAAVDQTLWIDDVRVSEPILRAALWEKLDLLKLLACYGTAVQFRGRRMLWQDSCLRILRTFTFGPAAGAFNARHPLKLEELLDRPVIVELDQELPKPLRVFLSDILLRWIHLYRLGQGETENLRHVTFLEEVHNLFPRSQAEYQTTNSLENVFREIRGFGEGLVSITQHPSLIPIYILGNCNTQIYLGLQHEEDIFTARRALFLEPGEEAFLDQLQVGEGIVKIKGRTGPCLVKFPLVSAAAGGEENGEAGLG